MVVIAGVAGALAGCGSTGSVTMSPGESMNSAAARAGRDGIITMSPGAYPAQTVNTGSTGDCVTNSGHTAAVHVHAVVVGDAGDLGTDHREVGRVVEVDAGVAVGRVDDRVRNHGLLRAAQTVRAVDPQVTARPGHDEVVAGNSFGAVNYTPTSCVPSPTPRAMNISGRNLTVTGNTWSLRAFVYPGTGTVSGNSGAGTSGACSGYVWRDNTWTGGGC